MSELIDQQLPPTQGQIAELLASMGVLSEEMDHLRLELHRANLRTRIAKFAAISAILLTLVAGWLAVEARHQTDEITDYRANAQVASCIQTNNLIVGIRGGIVQAGIAGIVTFAPDPEHLTADEQVKLAAYAAALAQGAEDAVPFRDCSEEGLAAYYSATPTDPATQPTVPITIR